MELVSHAGVAVDLGAAEGANAQPTAVAAVIAVAVLLGLLVGVALGLWVAQ